MRRKLARLLTVFVIGVSGLTIPSAAQAATGCGTWKTVGRLDFQSCIDLSNGRLVYRLNIKNLMSYTVYDIPWRITKYQNNVAAFCANGVEAALLPTSTTPYFCYGTVNHGWSYFGKGIVTDPGYGGPAAINSPTYVGGE